MASAYFRQFAIDNHLTVDYGYMYGKYRNLFISLKETLGSTKILYIMGEFGKDKETLRKVLSVFSEEELPKYCITDLKVLDNYLQFTFEINNDRCKLIAEFLNRFIDSCIQITHVFGIRHALYICQLNAEIRAETLPLSKSHVCLVQT